MTLRVEVAYALPQRQHIVALEVEEGCTIFAAALRSGINQLFPEIDLDTAKLGVFGKLAAAPRETPVHDGDRVEIYRPLLIDPKAVRRERAAQNKS